MNGADGVAVLAYAERYWVAKLWITDCGWRGDLTDEQSKAVKQRYRQGTLIGLDSYRFSALANELRASTAFREKFVVARSVEYPAVLLVRLSNPIRFPLDYKWAKIQGGRVVKKLTSCRLVAPVPDVAVGYLASVPNSAYCFLAKASKGNYKVQAVVSRHLELERVMWYLSTLGGAFSALGDISIKYARQAGRISCEQLKIAFLLGDPITVARCRLYIAIYYIQTGSLRLAKHIIRQQYRYAVSSSVADNRLLKNACLGVWSKLQYAYHLQRLKANSAVCDNAKDGLTF